MLRCIRRLCFSPTYVYMKFFKPMLHRSISHFFCNSQQPRFYRVSCIFYYEHNKYAVDMFFKTTNARCPAPSPLVISLILCLYCSPHQVIKIAQKFNCLVSSICSSIQDDCFLPSSFPLHSLHLLSSSFLFSNPYIPTSFFLRANDLLLI